MWSARSGGCPPGRAGNLPARTNDIDLDERRKTLTGGGEGGRSCGHPGFDRLHESTVSQALCCDDS